ncbi:MAG: hypothetical protein IPP40_17605 [bacterium]|nr:hypothetical protein [bacterium]
MLTIELHWDEVAFADSFRVYFGTASQPPLVAQQTALAFDPGDLVFNTLYYWRVEAVNEDRATSSPEWNFTTEESSGAKVRLSVTSCLHRRFRIRSTGPRHCGCSLSEMCR